MKDFGVKVLIKETEEYGYITRRLDSQNYEIWTESEKELTLGPSEFIEIKSGAEMNQPPIL